MDSVPEFGEYKNENPRILEQDSIQSIINKKRLKLFVSSSNCLGKFPLQFEEDLFWLFRLFTFSSGNSNLPLIFLFVKFC